MAKEIKTEILISARPEKVWAILTNFDDYPRWNPFIKSLKGNLVVGKKIQVTLMPPKTKAMTFTPTIMAYNPNTELRWLGQVLMPGLFDGEHRFELIDNHDGTTLFKHSEQFKGILVPLFKKMLEVNTPQGFMLMNEKLKALAENTI